jgi:excisionase family DNA binding protein
MSDRLAAAMAELIEALREELRSETRPPAPDRLLDVDEASSALGIGRSKAYDLIAAGELHSVKVGRRRLVPAASIATYIRAAQESSYRAPSAAT